MACGLFLKAVEGENPAVENANCLAAFVHARRSVAAGGVGLSDACTARPTKALTGNFDRRGAICKELNAPHPFYNASIQGRFRIIGAIAGIRKCRRRRPALSQAPYTCRSQRVKPHPTNQTPRLAIRPAANALGGGGVCP